MRDIMKRIPIHSLIEWIFDEYKQSESIFSINKENFFEKKDNSHIKLFGETCEVPVGPAAGPHTQLAQNIIAAYLSGSRFFELKTVQILDKLEFEKPCIEPQDECYNTEWSTELAIGRWVQNEEERKELKGNAFDEYIKAWFILHILQKKFNLSKFEEKAFIFNMSVGYNLEGIKSPKVDEFIESLKDAKNTPIFQECKQALKSANIEGIDQTFIDNISSNICTSITLSTMHGCPPDEIEKIANYLMYEKKINTYIKLNPTLMGAEFISSTFKKLGFAINQKPLFFEHDLKYNDAIPMIKRLQEFALESKVEFGVKLSNTLETINEKAILPGDTMYMSGRALYPITINLAAKLAEEFQGNLKISYSGGADFSNIDKIFKAGIKPITMATTLLKPGGYTRFKQIAEKINPFIGDNSYSKLNIEALKEMAQESLQGESYKKEKHFSENRKMNKELPTFNCFTDPCSVQCPINQDIPEYLNFIAQNDYENALKVIIAKNPLPFTTGTICPHTCMNKCTRVEYETPVKIREMKLLAAGNAYDKIISQVSRTNAKSNIKVAIIGAGPAGLSSGYFLAREGFDITIFDKEENAGGTVANVIPEFRIERAQIEKDINLAKKLGVKFVFGVNPEFSVQKLKEEGYKYVIVAIGASKNTFADVKGITTLNAIEFLSNFNKEKETLNIGKNIAIIGGGNTAMDASRAAKKIADNVYIIYRRTIEEMPADKEELLLAQEEGVIFKNLLIPVSYENKTLKCEKMTLGQKDASGRRKPIPTGEFETLAIDNIISAIGEKVDYDLLGKNAISKIANPKTLETNLIDVYLSGDVKEGPATVVEAIADATKVAKSIMFKEGIIGYENKFEAKYKIKENYSELKTKKAILIDSQNNSNEAKRCLECNLLCNICSQVCPNRANVQIEVPGQKNKNQIIHIDGMCNECGNCEAFCPYIGAPYKDKFTLFWLENDFENSPNNGFLLKEKTASQVSFKVKYKEKVALLSFDNEGKTNNCLFPKELTDLIWTAYKNYSYLFIQK